MTDQGEMLANRVRKNLRKLKSAFAKQGIEAFRLYDRDIPEIRAVVDWYAGHIVVGEYTRTQTEGTGWLEAMGDALQAALGLEENQVHLKRRQTRPEKGTRYERQSKRGQRIEVRERDLRFLVNLDDYVDTGLFADHRETRKMLGDESRGRRFLNLFGYTGSFTCYAARGGAASTTTVDASRTYLRWTRDNLELNELWDGKQHLIQSDVLEFLDGARAKKKAWNLCLVDPPSFSTRGGPDGPFDIQRDHRWLLEKTLAVIEPGGVLYFSTNHQRFEPGMGGLRVKSIENISDATVPVDYRNQKVHQAWRIIK